MWAVLRVVILFAIICKIAEYCKSGMLLMGK
jgi:hypothetical protein